MPSAPWKILKLLAGFSTSVSVHSHLLQGGTTAQAPAKRNFPFQERKKRSRGGRAGERNRERCEGLSTNMEGVGEHTASGDTGLETGVNRKDKSRCSHGPDSRAL